jgi:hypothetical protein
MATPTIPPGQEGGLVRIEEAAATAMARLARGEHRALEVPPHGTPAEPDLVRDRVQRPALPMVAPDLLVGGHPLGSPRGGERQCPGGRLRGRERHGAEAGPEGRGGGIVHGRRRTGMLGSDACQLRGVGPEHVREVLQQVKPIGDLAGRGRPEARRFRIGLGPIPHEHLDPGMGLKPLGDSSGYGIHGYWLFREPWRFEDDAERHRAAHLLRRFQSTIIAAGKLHGWDLDSTFNLAQVLRVPGTCNRKVAADVREVTIR